MISLELIDALRETKYQLQCEWSMNRVETNLRKQQYDAMLVIHLNLQKHDRNRLKKVKMREYRSAMRHSRSWRNPHLSGLAFIGSPLNFSSDSPQKVSSPNHDLP
jgi:hypothetical protein